MRWGQMRGNVGRAVAALEDESLEQVVDFFSGGGAGRNRACQLADVLQGCPASERKRLDKALHGCVRRAIAALQGEADGPASPQSPADANRRRQDAGRLLEIVADGIENFVTRAGSEEFSQHLLDAAVAMHNDAFVMIEGMPALRDAVSQMCEACWKKKIAGRENLVAATVVYLLYSAVSSPKPAAFAKRLFHIKEGLQELDYEDENTEFSVKCMLRAAMYPPFLRVAEGKKLVAFFFQLSDYLVKELTAVIRNQITSGRPSLLQCYGEVLFRAWKDAPGPQRLHIEGTIESLVQCAVLARSPPLLTSILHVLDYLHQQRLANNPTARALETLLCRCYEPIAFPALAAANPLVRANAVRVVAAAFPIQDSARSVSDNDALVARAVGGVSDALTDPSPAVRVAAAEGAAALLGSFWELVPRQHQRCLLDTLSGKLAFDGASPLVRAAAVDSLALVMDNPLSGEALRPVLPRLAPLVRDPSPKVRAAVFQLLTSLSISRHVGLGVFAVVPVEDLLSCLEADPCATKVLELVAPTFFPGSDEGDFDLLVALLRESEDAGVALCRAVAHSLASGKGRGKRRGPAVTPEVADAAAATLLSTLLAHRPAGQAAPAAEVERPPRKRRGQASAAGEAELPEMPEAEWSAVLTGLVELASRAGADPTVAPSRLLGKGNASELLSRCPGGRCRGLALRLLSAAHGSEAAADLTRRIAKAALCGDGALHSRAARDAALAGELMGSLACLAGSEREWASVWGGTTAALRGEGGDVAGALHIVGAAMADDRLREATLQSGAVTAVHEALLFAARGGADGAQDGASDPEGHALALRALAAVLACKVAMHCHLGSEERLDLEASLEVAARLASDVADSAISMASAGASSPPAKRHKRAKESGTGAQHPETAWALVLGTTAVLAESWGAAAEFGLDQDRRTATMSACSALLTQVLEMGGSCPESLGGPAMAWAICTRLLRAVCVSPAAAEEMAGPLIALFQGTQHETLAEAKGPVTSLLAALLKDAVDPSRPPKWLAALAGTAGSDDGKTGGLWALALQAAKWRGRLTPSLAAALEAMAEGAVRSQDVKLLSTAVAALAQVAEGGASTVVQRISDGLAGDDAFAVEARAALAQACA